MKAFIVVFKINKLDRNTLIYLIYFAFDTIFLRAITTRYDLKISKVNHKLKTTDLNPPVVYHFMKAGKISKITITYNPVVRSA